MSREQHLVGAIYDAPTHAGGTPLDYSDPKEVENQVYWVAQQAGIALAKRWAQEGRDPREARRAVTDLVEEGYAVVPIEHVSIGRKE